MMHTAATTQTKGGPDGELSAPQQEAMISALAERLSATAPGKVQRIDTHISVVLLDGEHAYKFKKALQTPFLDQSTLARRRRACVEELRLNGRLAADLYLGVVPVTGTPSQPALNGAGPLLDVAVKMRAFDGAALWDRLAARGALGPAQVDALAAVVARFHDAAAVADPAGWRGSPPQVRQMLHDNLAELAALAKGAGMRRALQRLRRAEPTSFKRLQGAMATRLAAGGVRECHGDLHLGNVVQHDGRVTLFDGIEFNNDWRWIDVVNEIAFTAMDLHAHGLTPLAHRFVNAYSEMRGDYAGLRLLPCYTAYRALVRAKVALLRAAQPGADTRLQHCHARRCLALALACGKPRRPTLFITHGPSGSGKTTLTQSLLEATGAVRIRADAERQRLAGMAALANGGSRLAAGPHSPVMTAATYARLLELAAPVVDAGCHAILDATFLQRAQRDAARRWAAARGLPFVLLDFAAAPALLRQRVSERAARGGDASGVDLPVLEAQLRSAEPLQADELTAVHAVTSSAAAAAPASATEIWGPLLDSLRRGAGA